MALGLSKFEQLGGMRRIKYEQAKRKAKGASEADEMRALKEYLKLKKLDFTHVANENPSAMQRMYLASLGVSKGFPDMVIFTDVCLLCVELKVAQKSKAKISSEQTKWIKRINSYAYAKARVCYGALEAIEWVESVVNG